MVKTIGVILLFLFIAFFQLKNLVKKKLFKEIWISLLILTSAALLSILKVHDMNIPNPLELISITLDPFIKLFSTQ
ncbi:hypothetical protein [Ornithinibacillus sp. 179-J 7C1 HS]|uniref:hypothetical protein n=1 Tax=Ornithinibacillus sp. 179-J 7C1 HS TaxID=3142384 RepID=UPI0039A322E2